MKAKRLDGGWHKKDKPELALRLGPKVDQNSKVSPACDEAHRPNREGRWQAA
jgi:hypothetical protein